MNDNLSEHCQFMDGFYTFSEKLINNPNKLLLVRTISFVTNLHYIIVFLLYL